MNQNGRIEAFKENPGRIGGDEQEGQDGGETSPDHPLEDGVGAFGELF